MRSDIVPGAIFPDYEISDHTAKRRNSRSIPGSIWSSSASSQLRVLRRRKGRLAGGPAPLCSGLVAEPVGSHSPSGASPHPVGSIA